MTNTTITATRKIGQNRGKPRLWIEGKLLIEAGFHHGALWHLSPHSDGLGFDIQLHQFGKRKVSGNPMRPVIDIAGSTLTEFGYAIGDKAGLTVTPGTITVR